ncbi:MAG: hypothetical protein EOS33_07820 [Mesorhizobium sp.]|nr:MAG: hypothetical protein EOS33_07820 [Mesorhizobium sp.]
MLAEHMAKRADDRHRQVGDAAVGQTIERIAKQRQPAARLGAGEMNDFGGEPRSPPIGIGVEVRTPFLRHERDGDVAAGGQFPACLGHPVEHRLAGDHEMVAGLCRGPFHMCDGHLLLALDRPAIGLQLPHQRFVGEHDDRGRIGKNPGSFGNGREMRQSALEREVDDVVSVLLEVMVDGHRMLVARVQAAQQLGRLRQQFEPHQEIVEAPFAEPGDLLLVGLAADRARHP